MIAATFVFIVTTGCAGQTHIAKQVGTNEIRPLVLVYLGGFVQRPGAYHVPTGGTYGDAVNLAGGFRPEADTAKFDASKIIEGTVQIYVSGIKETAMAQDHHDDSRTASKSTDGQTKSGVDRKSSVPVYRLQQIFSLTSEEQQMFELVNKERQKARLKPFIIDPLLVKAARLKSQDMIDNQYFDHISAKYGTPGDLISAQGVSYRYAGENIAITRTLEQAHTGLMNSPGHRKNILSSSFTRIGIGIIRGPRGLTVSQEFTG